MRQHESLPCGFWDGGQSAHPPRPRPWRGPERPMTHRPGCQGAIAVVECDHHSPHRFIRGATPRCRMRRSVIRQSARLFSRRQSATGTEGVVRATGLRDQVGSVSPDALDSTIRTPSRRKTSGRIALIGRGLVRRPFEIGGRAARSGGAVAHAPAGAAVGDPASSGRASAACSDRGSSPPPHAGHASPGPVVFVI